MHLVIFLCIMHFSCFIITLNKRYSSRYEHITILMTLVVALEYSSLFVFCCCCFFTMGVAGVHFFLLFFTMGVAGVHSVYSGHIVIALLGNYPTLLY